jgi:dipeptidyl aminopeptidase/acylaminoacyl peptidase
VLLWFAPFVAAQSLTVKEIMAEPSITGMRVQDERLSPDGKWLVFLWNSEGKQPLDLYIVPALGGSPQKWLSPAEVTKPKEPEKKDENEKLDYGVVVKDDFEKSRRNQFGNLRWSPDSSKLLFTQGGDIFVIGIGEKTPKRVTKTETSEFAADFLDNSRIAFQQNGDVYSISTADGTLTQISKESDSKKNISVSGAATSDDGSMIAYIASDGSKQKGLFVPNYLGYYTAAPTLKRGWNNQKIYIAKTDASWDKSIEAEFPKSEGESYFYGIEWNSDGTVLIADRIDRTHKRRQIYAVTFADGKSSAFLVHEESDDKWIGGPSRILENDPTDPSRFLFGSEKDGWQHLYLVKLDRSKFADSKANTEVIQLTRGDWQVEWARWTADGKGVVFSSTKDSPRWREFYKLDPASGNASRLSFESTDGMMKTSAQLESGTLVYEASNVITPGEIYSASVSGGAEKKLTITVPEDFTLWKWKSPLFTEFAARDKKKVPVKIYLPESHSKARRYPMIIFVHGAGYLQNVINGWNNYYREFMFNEMLRRKGYVVLDIDYRGSAGYGRDWRTDVYDFLGGLDYTDHVDAIDFMVKEYSVDVDRIGVYGGSYGGFMAAMLVMRSPDKIKAAAALRPVMDWKNYYSANPFYTSQRLGIPNDNPEAYKRSSPISYADQLRRKLLILHGLVDSNVHVQDSIQLVEQLIRLDKTEYFELMLYPSENHGFERPASWEDEYERILDLFETELN